MRLAVIDAYSISVWLHITAVVVGFGATFAEAIMFPVAQKLGTRHLPYVHRLQRAINQFLASPALVLILLTGVYQTLDDERNFSFGDPWISATLAIVIVIGGLLGAYFIPEDRRLEAMVERELAAARGEGEAMLSDEYRRRARREGVVGTITGLLIITAIFLMVTKPGGVG